MHDDEAYLSAATASCRGSPVMRPACRILLTAVARRRPPGGGSQRCGPITAVACVVDALERASWVSQSAAAQCSRPCTVRSHLRSRPALDRPPYLTPKAAEKFCDNMETSYERKTTTKTYNVTHNVPPHSLVITRTSGVGASQGGGKTVTRTMKTSSGGSGGDIPFTEGQYAMMTTSSVKGVKETRDQERKDMQDLNDRFANYIDKVTSSYFCIVLWKCYEHYFYKFVKCRTALQNSSQFWVYVYQKWSFFGALKSYCFIVNYKNFVRSLLVSDVTDLFVRVSRTLSNTEFNDLLAGAGAE